ncbi:MAG: glutamine synthetase family protein [Candidatus Marinimicrobia bacterium]|nr:glutamine synthetase family protein [Candidatus Neomarinimicrobiota bacterium]
MSLSVASILGISPKNLQRSDLLNFINRNEIKRITFHYTAGDGRLKQLILPVNSMNYAERILAAGERVDGSSLFKGMVGTSASDLYVVPVYASAFIDPFDEKGICFLCRFLDKDEKLAEFCPDNILMRAAESLKQKHGYDLWALGELEFYLIGDQEDELYPMPAQGGYHASGPFSRYIEVVKEMLEIIADITAHVKYGHTEVGTIRKIESADDSISGKYAEQFEVEFLPAPIEWAADYLSLAKYVVRNVAAQYDLLATFAPKLESGYAGTGLHFHVELLLNNNNIMTNAKGELSTVAKQAIGGLLRYAPSLTAFGNTIAASHLRLVPGQESPTKLFWSDFNRAALIRVPLGWQHGEDMASVINHRLKDRYISPFKRQTIELRSADGSAFIHLLLAGITLGIEYGLDHGDVSLKLANKRHIRHGDEIGEEIPELPLSCFQSAQYLREESELYKNLIPEDIINHVCAWLEAEDDAKMSDELQQLSAEDQRRKTLEIMHRCLHVG